MAKIIKIHPENPHQRAINQVVDVLKSGGIIIYPTDTIYGMGCDITNHKAMERLARLKGKKLDKVSFSIVCNDLSHLSEFSKPISNPHFKLLKKALPGSFTFVLNASKQLPASYKNRKTVGIRVPNHLVPQLIVKQLGSPIASTSIHSEDQIIEYTTDPEIIADRFGTQVDLIIDSGYGNNIPSTIVDLTEDEPSLIRQGAGNLQEFL